MKSTPDVTLTNDRRERGFIKDVYEALYSFYGPQYWWPAKTPFEVMVGAILVQNTNWKNVEKVVARLEQEKLLNFETLASIDPVVLSALIKPAGYYNIKARRLKNFLGFFGGYKGSVAEMQKRPWQELREELLTVNGIGPETADSILLYALGKPVFVVDAYTKRFLMTHGWGCHCASYHEMQTFFMRHLPSDCKIFNEYHALLVRLGKDFGPEFLKNPDYPLRDKKFFLRQEDTKQLV